MTKQEAERLGCEYYYDNEEPYGCCKTDGDCSACTFVDICSEANEM